MSSKTTTQRARQKAVTHEARATRLRFALDRIDTMLEELGDCILQGRDTGEAFANIQKVVDNAIKSDDQRLEPEALKQVQEAVREAMKRVGEQEAEDAS